MVRVSQNFLLVTITAAIAGIISVSTALQPLQRLSQVPAQPLTSIDHPRRTALIIGNSDYQQVGKLLNPVNDAQDIADSLKGLGFDVLLLKNASLRQIDDAMSRFSQKLKQGGVGVFYYAGHGLQVDGENYLIPVDAKLDRDLDVRYETLPLGKVLNVMEEAGNNANILILDACRNNPFKRKWAGSSRAISGGGLAAIEAVKGSYIAYATAPGKIAFDGQGRNGTFTSYLLKNIKTPNLSVEGLFKLVRQGVASETNNRQIPWDSSSLVGDFSFNPAQPPVVAIATTPPPIPPPLSNPSPTSTFSTSATVKDQAPSSTPIPPQPDTRILEQPSLSTTQTAFVGLPRLIKAESSNNTVAAWSATYYFTVEIPVNAGTGLHQIKIQLTEGADQDIQFDLQRSEAFEGDSFRKNNPKIILGKVENDPKAKAVLITFVPPVTPGKTITLGLQPYHNPSIGGTYLFDVLVYPLGENAKPQSLGYGRLTFYTSGH